MPKGPFLSRPPPHLDIELLETAPLGTEPGMLPRTAERQSLVTFRLEPFDGGTELTLTHERLPDEPARASHEHGWNGLLDKLPVFLGAAP